LKTDLDISITFDGPRHEIIQKRPQSHSRQGIQQLASLRTAKPRAGVPSSTCAAANAPENDVWRLQFGKLEGGQIKAHSDANPARYMRDMLKDTKAEYFIVPDDHVAPLRQGIQQRITAASAAGDGREAMAWQRELARVQPLGRTYAELETAVTRSAQATVRCCAVETAGGTAMIALSVDGVVLGYRCAHGKLTPSQAQEGATEAIAKAGAVGVVTAAAIMAGANPVGITVIVVGGVVYLVAEYAIEELRPSYTSTPLTAAQIDRAMPVGWQRDDK
jgi:hypothetical protein